MKKFLLAVVIVFAAFLFVRRERIYVRDPLASLTRDGVIEGDTRIYINYSNEVLLEHVRAPVSLVIVQQGQHIGTPRELRCIHWLACMTDADKVDLIEVMSGPVGEMSGKLVQFRDDQGRNVEVKLR